MTSFCISLDLSKPAIWWMLGETTIMSGEAMIMMRALLLVTTCLGLMADAAFADGDIVAGEKVFQRCVSCHVVDDKTNGKGPTLRGVVGRPVASVDGFAYSDAMKAFGATGAVWDVATLDKFFKDPISFIIGVKMVITPVRRDTDRANLIAFLKSNM
jgi:cytochrome c